MGHCTFDVLHKMIEAEGDQMVAYHKMRDGDALI